MNKSNPGSNKPAAMFCGLLLAATSMLACEVGYKDIGDDPMGDGDGDGDPQGDGDGDGDTSDCDCPGADGYACVQGVCEWNYL